MANSRSKVLICAITLALLIFTASACSRTDQGPPITEQPQEFIPSVETLGETTEIQGPELSTQVSTENANTSLETIAYYLDEAGRIIPLARTIQKTEGVAKATLALLVSDDNNSIEIARLGLKPVLPTNTTIDLDINDGLARVDLQGTIQNDDAAEEAGMVSAIVETLTEFDSVDRVQLLINGMYVDNLPFGTPIGQPIAKGDINLEGTGEVATDDSEKVKLYFGSETGSMLVPVTRMVYSNADIDTAVVELIKGPKSDSGLKPCLPSDCGLIGVTVDKGVAKINFTKEFMDVTQQSDGGRLALKALILTCSQFDGVKEVKLMVDGKEYNPGVSTMATPQFINEVDFLTNVITPADTVSARADLGGEILYVGDDVLID